LLGEVRPVAVVLDILLEGESTWEFLADLKRQTQTRGIPVFVVTMVDNRSKAAALGADAFCPKPVDRAWLLERLYVLADPAAREKVLLIDDNEVSRYLLKGLLADTRFGTIEAEDGPEGMRLARTHRPRAVFLDLDLPGASGFEVLDSLRADEATRHIPVIIHTSKVLEEAERRRLSAASAVLSKENPSRDAAQSRLREALVKAGLSGNREGGGNG
jgi:CheY-like chemotaxis protein